jgi:phosphoribosyl-AMP cyclohydrolase
MKQEYNYSIKENFSAKEKNMSTDEKKSIETFLNELSFNSDGLVPAIAQQFDSQEVLMLAWMSRESIEATLSEKRVVYWSRSRKSLWRKGETSGHIQNLIELRWDCDNDAILLLVDQTGVACHTGRRNCFFRAIRDGKITTIARDQIDTKDFSQN